MRVKRTLHSIAGAMVIGALTLAGCGSAPTTAAPAPTLEPLPTPPPMPTSAPLPSTATPPPAPTAPPSVAGAPLLTSNFSSPLQNWQIIDSNEVDKTPSVWEVKDGRLVQISDGYGLPTPSASAIVTGDPSLSDYTVTISALAYTNEEMGVVFRASDKGYYVFRLTPAAANGGARVLSRFDAANYNFVTIAEAQGSGFAPETWYKLSVTVKGNTIKAYVNGTLALEATDSTLSSGKAGAYGFAEGGLIFDDMTIESAR